MSVQSDEVEAAITAALEPIIMAAMPWPFSDLDRDSLEASETAREMAEDAAVYVMAKLRQMDDDLRKESQP